MDIKEKLELIKKNTIEVVKEEELKKLLKGKKKLTTYCGYEPSGKIHLGHLVTFTKLMDLQKAGIKVKILLADWHGWLNQKGDWKFIDEQVKTWKKQIKAAGLKDAEIVIGTKFQRTQAYIDDVMKIAHNITINRALRSMQQVARDIEHAKVTQVIYPLMQIVDMKHMKIDIAAAGIEQRKIHMLGLEVFDEIGYKKPIFVHTPLIPSIKGPETKMTSSDESTLISIVDTDEEIKKKIKDAYCIAGESKDNPILMIAQLIIFPRYDKFLVERPEKFGGNLEFKDYKELEKAFVSQKLHPLDLKNSVARYLCEIIAPIRKAYKK